MDTKRLNIKEIFCAAIEKKTAAQRSAYLDEACGDNDKLRAEIEALLKAHNEADEKFLETPPGVDITLDDGPPAERPGTRIGRYKLLQMIGEGGFACVYMAEQEQPVRRKVAFKIIKLGMDTKQVIARFEAERQALALMDHPNIAKVFDGGATDTGRPYFVMELVKGIPITEYCDKNNLETRERLQLFINVCRAVQHAHQKGIIHRDIKPTNIMVTLHDGEAVPKVIDFGIAKAMQHRLTEKTLFTEYRQLIGTPEYMSPEQAEFSGLDVDTRTDIYSLGVLLYELLTGGTPFATSDLRSTSYDEMCRIIRETEPPKPSTRLSTLGDELSEVAKHHHVQPDELCRIVRGDLDWVVMKTLEKDRTRRYETANELAQDIERHLGDEAVLASPPSRVYRLRKFARRHRSGVAAGLLLSSSLVIGLSLAITGFVQASRQRNFAEAQRQRAAVNFQMARDAVEEMTRMAEKRLPNIAETKQVRRELLEQAKVFYAGFVEENSDDPAVLQEVGRAYMHVGNIHKTLGQHAEAENAYELAIEIFEEMVAEHPSVSSYKEDLARAYAGLAGVLARTGRLKAAEQTVRQQEQLLMDLAAEFPSLAEHQVNLAWCRCELGELLRLLGALDEAEQILRQETNFLENLVIEYPEARGVLARCYATLGHVLRYANQHEESVQAYQRSADLQNEMVEDFPDDAINKQALAQNMFSLGFAMHRASRSKEGQVVLQEAAELYEELVLEFPERGWELEMGGVYHHLGDTLNTMGRHQEAEQALRQALEINKKKAAEFPDVPDYRVYVAAGDLAHLAFTFHMTGQMEQWEQVLGESLELHEQLVADCPENAYYRQDLVNHYRHQGNVLSNANREEEAAHAFHRAIELQEPLVVKFPHTACYKQDRANIFVELGQVLEKSGRWQEAEEVYQKAFLEYANAIELDPNNVRHWEERGRLCMDMEQWDEAIADLSEAIEVRRKFQAAFPDVPVYQNELADTYENLGRVLLRVGQPREAEQSFRQAIEFRRKFQADLPDLPSTRLQIFHTYRWLANALERTGKISEAENADREAQSIMENLVAEFPGEREYRKWLADNCNRLVFVMMEKGEYEQAEDFSYNALDIYEQLVSDFPDVPVYQNELANTYENLGRVLIRAGQPREAEQSFRQAIEFRRKFQADLPDLPSTRLQIFHTYRWLANALERTGKISEAENADREAQSIMENLAAEFPGDGEYRNWLADHYDRLASALKNKGKYEQGEEFSHNALDIYEQLVTDFPDVPAYQKELANYYIRQGNVLRKAGRLVDAEQAYQEALSVYGRAIETNPENADAYVQRGGFYVNMKQWDKAVADYSKAIEVDPNNPHAWQGRGRVYSNMERWDDAIADFSKAIELEPDLAVAWCRRVNAYAQSGQLNNADLDLEKVAELDPYQAAEVLNNCAWKLVIASAQERSPNWAVKLAEKAVELQQRKWYIWHTLGVAYYQAGQPEEAIEALRKSREAEPDSAIAWSNEALAHLGAGNTSKYRSTCATMLERFGQTEDLDIAHWVAWTCVLAPNAIGDLGQAVKLAELTIERGYRADHHRNTLGAILHRAGRFDEAVQQLNALTAEWKQGREFPTLISPAYTWFFLAMAHHQLGHADQSQRHFELALERAEREMTGDAEWHRKLILQLLRAEAAELLDISEKLSPDGKEVLPKEER